MRSLKTSAKEAILSAAPFFNDRFAYITRLQMGFARGAVNVASRRLDPEHPASWEFSAFSQNGEDGIADQLLSLVTAPNRYFVEIGASDGIENNSSYLAFAKRYAGVMVEGNAVKSGYAVRFLQPLNWCVKYLSVFVEPDTVERLLSECVHRDPDFFSLDIDGSDYHVMQALLGAGLRPKVVCVEYNSTFGPSAALTIPYTPQFDYHDAHPSELYFGASIAAWRTLFQARGYRFVTVDTAGVNAFFIDPAAVELPDGVQGVAFVETALHLLRYRTSWEGRFAKVRDLPLITVHDSP
jgi:hypothetical protein